MRSTLLALVAVAGCSSFEYRIHHPDNWYTLLAEAKQDPLDAKLTALSDLCQHPQPKLAPPCPEIAAAVAERREQRELEERLIAPPPTVAAIRTKVAAVRRDTEAAVFQAKPKLLAAVTRVTRAVKLRASKPGVAPEVAAAYAELERAYVDQYLAALARLPETACQQELQYAVDEVTQDPDFAPYQPQAEEASAARQRRCAGDEAQAAASRKDDARRKIADARVDALEAVRDAIAAGIGDEARPRVRDAVDELLAHGGGDEALRIAAFGDPGLVEQTQRRIAALTAARCAELAADIPRLDGKFPAWSAIVRRAVAAHGIALPPAPPLVTAWSESGVRFGVASVGCAVDPHHANGVHVDGVTCTRSSRTMVDSAGQAPRSDGTQRPHGTERVVTYLDHGRLINEIHSASDPAPTTPQRIASFEVGESVGDEFIFPFPSGPVTASLPVYRGAGSHGIPDDEKTDTDRLLRHANTRLVMLRDDVVQRAVSDGASRSDPDAAMDAWSTAWLLAPELPVAAAKAVSDRLSYCAVPPR